MIAYCGVAFFSYYLWICAARRATNFPAFLDLFSFKTTNNLRKPLLRRRRLNGKQNLHSILAFGFE
jgi:hypothetical protein